MIELTVFREEVESAGFSKSLSKLNRVSRRQTLSSGYKECLFVQKEFFASQMMVLLVFLL